MTNDLIEAQTVPQDDGFGLTAVTRLYHAKLHRLAKEMGTQKAVAKYLGVSSCLFNQWVNLKNLPPKEPHNRGGRLWKKSFFDEVEKKLFELTGETWDELWPQELRDAVEINGLITQKEQLITVEPQQLLTYAREEAARLEAVDPTKSAEVSELRESLIRALKHLSYREREIIKLRFGIDYDQAFTLQECAHIFKMTRERARQIQRKAIRKMQSYAPELAQHLPAGDDGNVDTDECEHLRKWDEWDEIHR
jgi:RNA polymerase sigma factor (sigma-70 family)|tara:strand:+ start:3297 stop:4046 length:750 start_codon:yes stop_codon:yes gene_type:complete